MGVKRYDMDSNGDDYFMTEDPEGAWVEYAEVERLRSQLEGLAKFHAERTAELSAGDEDTERSLAAANALLAALHPFWVRLPRKLRQSIQAHLAAQPATAHRYALIGPEDEP